LFQFSRATSFFPGLPFSSPDSARHLPRIWRKRKATHVRRCHSTHATGEANPSHLHLAPTTQPTTYSTTSPTTDAAAPTHHWCCRCHPPRLKFSPPASSFPSFCGSPGFWRCEQHGNGKATHVRRGHTPHHSPARVLKPPPPPSLSRGHARRTAPPRIYVAPRQPPPATITITGTVPLASEVESGAWGLGMRWVLRSGFERFVPASVD
jgi:hypothetical protein